MFLGTAIHDTAQVTGAALIYQQIYDLDKVIDIATVTKLTRNLFLILIIPLISFLFYKFSVNNMQKLEKGKIEWYSFIPLFVIGFLLLVFLRTIGAFTFIHTEAAFGFLEKDDWEKFHKNTGNFGMTYILGIAMAGVGLSTNFKTLKGIG